MFSQNLETVRHRYRSLAPIYPFFELVFLLPRGIRNKAVERLRLAAGEKVLKIGCGAGRNLRYLGAAVGPGGRAYAVDYSEAMLGRAQKLCEKSGWHNLTLLQEDAARLTLPEMVDGVLLSLCYSVLPNPHDVLGQVWKYLRPGKRLVVVDGKLANGLAGR